MAERVKKGTIFKNTYAGHETYFIYQGAAQSYGIEAPKVKGIGMSFIDGKWKVKECEYYKQTLRETEQFPAIGSIDIDRVVTDAVLAEIKRHHEDVDANNN